RILASAPSTATTYYFPPLLATDQRDRNVVTLARSRFGGQAPRFPPPSRRVVASAPPYLPPISGIAMSSPWPGLVSGGKPPDSPLPHAGWSRLLRLTCHRSAGSRCRRPGQVSFRGASPPIPPSLTPGDRVCSAS